MMTLFVLQHETASDDVKLIGLYTSLEGASAARDRAAARPGFRDGGEFSIDRYETDRDHWTEGFVTLDEDGQVLSRSRAA